MIVRTWRGFALASTPEAYPEHFRRAVLPELAGPPGFLGAQLLKTPDGDRVEFLVITRWESLEAIRSFAGPRAEKAVVEPGAVRALVSFDEEVRHYEVIEDTQAGAHRLVGSS